LAIDLAMRRRDEASSALTQVQRGWLEAQNQMGQLESYAAETESNWALGSRTSAQPEIMRHYGQFMDRLQQAVDMQRAVVGDHLRATVAAKQVLLEAEIRVAGLKRLLDKRRQSLARSLASREQKQLDDLSALQFRRRHAGSETLGTP
jgi:flagellar FliJ protein